MAIYVVQWQQTKMIFKHNKHVGLISDDIADTISNVIGW